MGYISNVISDVNGTVVGYLYVDKDGLAKAICKQAMFQKDVIADLTSPDSGYKYYDYNHTETITDATGATIDSLPSIPESTMDAVQTTSFKTSLQRVVSSSQITDAEFSAKYKTFTETSVIEFKEGEYTIKTREDFIGYLNYIDATYKNYCPGINMPLNYFVAPEARFTLEELNDERNECHKYLPIILKRHSFRNYEDYEKLLDWLIEKGVLKTKTPTMLEFLQAYNSWGVDGINAKCIGVKGEVNVDGDFNAQLSAPKVFEGPDGPVDYALQNRKRVPVIVDGNLDIHYLRDKCNIGQRISIAEFGRDILSPMRDEAITYIKRSSGDGYKYKAFSMRNSNSFGLRKSEDRYTLEFIDDNGFTYTYAQTSTKIKFKRNSSFKTFIFVNSNFRISYLLKPNSYIDIEVLKSKDDYVLWNYALYKLQKLTKASTVNVDIYSSSDMLRRAGLSPRSIVGYVSNYINEHLNTEKYGEEYARLANILNLIYETAIYSIPEWLYTSFQLDPNQPLSLKEFIESADIDDLMNRHEAMMRGELVKGDEGYDEHLYYIKGAADVDVSMIGSDNIKTKLTFDPLEDSLGYYQILKLAYDCLYGDIDIGSLATGRMLDDSIKIIDYVAFIMSLVYTELGVNPDVNAAMQLINNLDSSNLVPLSEVTFEKNNAYHGSLIDKAILSLRQVSETTWWSYINRIYREISNAPTDKQRPYLLEMVSLDPLNSGDRYLMDAVSDLVESAIEASDLSDTKFTLPDEDGFTYSEKSCALSLTKTIAAKILYLIVGKQITVSEGMSEVQKEIDYDGFKINVTIPAELIHEINAIDIGKHTIFITLNELCINEYNMRAGKFLNHIVNASIDPWHVRPKAGFKIRELPLLVNWFDSKTLISAQGEDLYKTALSNNVIKNNIKAIINPSNPRTEFGKFASTSTDEDPSYYSYHLDTELSGATDLSYFDYLLGAVSPSQNSSRVSELIEDYVTRWSFTRKYAKSNGKKVLSIPLVQDRREHTIADIYCEEIPSTNPVLVDTLPNPMSFIKDISTNMLQYTENKAIGVNKVNSVWKARIYNFEDADQNLSKYISVLNNECVLQEAINVSILSMRRMGSTGLQTIKLATLTDDYINKLISNKVFIELGYHKYLIWANNGIHVIEEIKV